MDLYVGNLSPEITEDELQKTFEPFGKVSIASIIKDHLTGATRGFGFVDMPHKKEAESAMTGLNGKKLNGHKLEIRQVIPRREERRKNDGRRSLP